MGTNYYAETAPCPAACEHCSRATQVHICKSLINFRGYIPDPDWPDEPFDDRLGEIRDWATWRAVLRSPEVLRIVDEYGHEHDTEEFITSVEATSLVGRRRQYEWMSDHRYDEVARGHEWIDPDGFSFSSSAFS
jgi:hypothetical protein